MELEAVLDRLHARVVASAWLQVFTALTRALLALAFVPSGLVKVAGHRFTTLSPETPVGYFFDGFFSAQGYYRFVGVAQVLALCLLPFRSTAALGAVLYFPIILNIFVITASVGFGFTAVIAGLLLLGCAYLLAWDYDRWKALLPGFGAGAPGVRPRGPETLVTLGLVAGAGVGFLGLMGVHRAWLTRTRMLGPLVVMLAGALIAARG